MRGSGQKYQRLCRPAASPTPEDDERSSGRKMTSGRLLLMGTFSVHVNQPPMIRASRSRSDSCFLRDETDTRCIKYAGRCRATWCSAEQDPAVVVDDLPPDSCRRQQPTRGPGPTGRLSALNRNRTCGLHRLEGVALSDWSYQAGWSRYR